MTRPPLTLAQTVARARELPSAPWLLPKLMDLLNDADAAADQVEALIKLDAGLASGTLRLANSAYFNNSMPCDTVADAIVRLGFQEIYRLATTRVASRWLQHDVKGYGWEPGDLYRHSLTVAVAADLIAQETGLVRPEIAYTAGLLHDVGKLALAVANAESFGKVRDLQAQKHCPWREAEHHVFGYDHTDVAAELLRIWVFPPNLIQVARYYPRPRLADNEHRSLVAHIHAAKHLALCLGTGVGEEGFHADIDEEVLRQESITPDMGEILMPAVLERSDKLLRGETLVAPGRRNA